MNLLRFFAVVLLLMPALSNNLAIPSDVRGLNWMLRSEKVAEAATDNAQEDSNFQIQVDPVEGLVTDENGAESHFQILLNAQPTAPVFINLASSDPTEGKVSTSQEVFTPGNWANPRIVTITGQDDTLADGDQNYTIQITAQSLDIAYNIDPPDVSVINIDNEATFFVFARDDSYTTDRNKALNVPAPGVLQNDTIANPFNSSARVINNPSNGTLNLNSNGSFSYVPYPGFYGSDSFTYEASNGWIFPSRDTANVTITVAHNNLHQPVAQHDQYQLDEDTSINISAGDGVLKNDSDGDFDSLSAVRVRNPVHGSVTLNTDGSFGYSPQANFYGTDTFTYRASDGTFTSDEVTVTLQIKPVNDPPAAEPDRYLTNATSSRPFVINQPANGVLKNDTDQDGDPLTASLIEKPQNGILVLNPDGTFTYTPDSGFGTDAANAIDHFTYQVDDGQGGKNTALVEIQVDVIPPKPAIWVLPDTGGSINKYSNGPIKLQVELDSTNQDVDRVVFYRWDPILNQRLELGTVSQAPYILQIDLETFNYAWNEVDAAVYDKAGNRSTFTHIWVVRNLPVAAYLPIISH